MRGYTLFLLLYKEAFPLKYLWGYITAAILAAVAWALNQFGAEFTTLVDMVYPYVIRTVQTFLAQWSSGVDFLVWQVLLVALVVVVLAGLTVVLVMKKNIIPWAGWSLALVCFVYLLQTLVYGLNYHAGDLADDIRLKVSQYNLYELVEATTYYRDRANVLAEQVKRDDNGELVYDEFEDLAKMAGVGFQVLTYDHRFPVFAGSTLPVKKLGWADMYTSMGITGFTCGLTGEAAVNPQIPDIALPFTMSHEMAHRMCIATERDANFAAFLACSVHPDVQFEYSAYFMAYRYCYNALASQNTLESANAIGQIADGVGALLHNDLVRYDTFFSNHRDVSATKLADNVNDTYLKASGDSAGVRSYGQVADLLVNWHIDQVVIPSLLIEQNPFDPHDETQVDLSGIVNAR